MKEFNRYLNVVQLAEIAHIHARMNIKTGENSKKKKKKIINRQRLKLDGLYGKKRKEGEEEIIMKPDENS